MTGKVRIIAGQWRGRKLTVPDRPGLRPTGDRVRETLFNWIGPRIVGMRALDLFAGSGALGLEAASRGASRVVLVERDPIALEALRSGPRHWPGSDAVEIVRADAMSWLQQAQGPFDLVLLDPPFESRLLEPALAALLNRPGLLGDRALIYAESAPAQLPSSWPDELELFRQKRQGQVVLTLLRHQKPAD